MTIRKADFVVSTASHKGFKDLGYVDEVEAICILNNTILVFTVRKVNRVFRKPHYQIKITLPDILTGRMFGIADFNTLEEAIDCGTRFVKRWFPLVTAEDLLVDISKS
jgi:hypothetical protein